MQTQIPSTVLPLREPPTCTRGAHRIHSKQRQKLCPVLSKMQPLRSRLKADEGLKRGGGRMVRNALRVLKRMGRLDKEKGRFAPWTMRVSKEGKKSMGIRSQWASVSG